MRARLKPPLLPLLLLAAGCVDLTRPPELSVPVRVPGDGAAADEPPAAPPPTIEADAATPAAPGSTGGSDDAALAHPPVGGSDGATAPTVDAPPPGPALLGTGARCDSGGQCQSGVCADGVCCGTACSQRCFACNLAGSIGDCKPVPPGEVRPGQCAAEPVAGCGLDGACDGQGGCRKYPKDTVCVAGTCSGDTELSARTCDGGGTCRPPTMRSCSPNLCMGSSCGTRCTGDGDCQPGFFCDAGACRTKHGVGEMCRRAVECGSGNCVDGVCCATACSEPCVFCAIPGSVGQCLPVPAGDDPRGNCPADPVASCGHDGACDGKGGCRLYAPGTACAGPTCSSGVALSERLCTAQGTCGGATPVSDCGFFACAGSACGATCTTGTDCEDSGACAGGSCTPPGLVLYWKLDEPAGTVARDSSGGGLDGTYLGSSGIPSPSPVTPPQARFLDGGSRSFVSAQRQFIEIATMPAALKPTAELTLTAWYRSTQIDGGGSGGEVITGGNNYLLRVRPGDVEYDKRIAGQHIRCFAAVGNHLDGNWHHLALVVDGTALRGYFDGVERCTTATTQAMTYDVGTAFRIGRHGQTADVYDFDGNIDEVRVYRRALPQPEIAGLAQGGR